MYITDIISMIPQQTYNDQVLHTVLNYILSFNIEVLPFCTHKNSLKSALRKIKRIIYKKYIHSVQLSTEYSDEYYNIYMENMETFTHIYKITCMHASNQHMMSILLKTSPNNIFVPPRHVSSYIATYQ